MDLRNVKDLQKKIRTCEVIHTVGLVLSFSTLFAGYVVYYLLSSGWGLALCCLAVVFALITGTAQVLGTYLEAEDMYRITGRRPKNKKKKQTSK